MYYHMKNNEELLHGICYSSFLQVVETAEAAVAAARNSRDALREMSRSHLVTTLGLEKEFSVRIMECRALGPEYRIEMEARWARDHMLTWRCSIMLRRTA